MAEIRRGGVERASMIGIIGPADSVALATSVAAEQGIEDQVIGRAYRRVEEAPALARDLERICQVLLFTGRVPYSLARAPADLTAVLRYVPHSGADLYRTLVHLVREQRGQLPRISLDTIEPAVVREAYEDLGLEPPRHILELAVSGDPERIRGTAEIVAFHRRLADAGEVDVCVTCLGEVDLELRESGIRSWRIAHTRSVLREALDSAALQARLAITETTQPAAVIVALAAQPPSGLAARRSNGVSGDDLQRRRQRARDAALDLAERLQGRLGDLDGETFIVHTNRGAIEGAVVRRAMGHGGPLAPERLPADVVIGMGIGATVPGAEENARRALLMGERDGELHLAAADGSVMRVGRDGPVETLHLRETDQAMTQLARQLGFGPLALTRLTRALRQVDASAVTAAELAQAYGIEPRSARRLMTALQRAGIASPQGRQGGPRAGRPQIVYRIDVDRLVPMKGDPG